MVSPPTLQLPEDQHQNQKHPRQAQRIKKNSSIRCYDNICLSNVVKAAAAILLIVKAFFFLHDNDPRHRPFYYNTRLPVRERHDASASASQKDIQLKFRENQAAHATDNSSNMSTAKSASFKILQLTDLHLGEATFTDWGPEQDRKTFRLLDTIIPLERPDLIVLSGDQLTANDIGQKNATSYYKMLGEHLSNKVGIPWALIFGNHDDAPFEFRMENGTIVKKPAMTSRAELLAVDRNFPLSLTQLGPNDLFGTSNYALPVYVPSGWPQWKQELDMRTPGSEYNNNLALQLIFLDSGGGSLPMKLKQNQLDWFRKIHQSTISGVAVFQHIPTNEFVYDGSTCQGLHDDPVDSIEKDPGIIKLLQEAGNVLWLGVGHDHGNDYCCKVNSSISSSKRYVHLCFGRHSGYGGYGHWDRGARVYDVKLTQGTTESAEPIIINWSSWVRLETGDIVHRYGEAAAI